MVLPEAPALNPNALDLLPAVTAVTAEAEAEAGACAWDACGCNDEEDEEGGDAEEEEAGLRPLPAEGAAPTPGAFPPAPKFELDEGAAPSATNTPPDGAADAETPRGASRT